MTIREQTEAIERQILHPRACLSSAGQGRSRAEKPDDLRTCFQRDRDRIIHCKSFRRLKHKTQVFLAPKGDHYRTRLTHVLEVSQIARTIARALRLNEDLTEAIALGHDLGHTPFGHAGEEALNDLHPGGFDHYRQSLRVVDALEKDGAGLNLTHEVRDGILKHSKGRGLIVPDDADERPATLEGQVVRVSDIIAYLNHDLDDAVRAGVIKRTDTPKEIMKAIGEVSSKRIDAMVRDVITTSIAQDVSVVLLSERMGSAVYALRDFLYERVYYNPLVRQELEKARGILTALYTHFMEHPEEAFRDFPVERRNDRPRLVCDFLASMTDRYALLTYERLFLPKRWPEL
jgi:dGTPase